MPPRLSKESAIMKLQTPVKDWKVAGLANTMIQPGKLGFGKYFFQFISESLRVRETVIFYCAGFGHGVGAGGVSWTPDDATSIQCDRAFSLADLHGASGNLESISVSPGSGYSLVRIYASKKKVALFTKQDVSGWGAGLSIGGFTSTGYWRSVKLDADRFENFVRRAERKVTGLFR
jgi:hypothetical protein